MSSLKNIEVMIDGIPVALVSDEKEEYIQLLAEYISEKLKQIKNGRGFITMHTQAMLLGLNIADDLFKEKEKKKETADEQSRRIRLNTENETLKKKIALLKEELDLKAEVLKENNELKEKVEKLQTELEHSTQAQEEIKRLQTKLELSLEQIKALENELIESRNELSEYIRVFDERT